MKKNTLSVFLLFFSGMLFSQSINVNTTTYTIPQLVQNVLINSPCAQVSNITWRSGNAVGSTNGLGYFSNSNPNFPMSNGVVMVTGTAASVAGPNNSILSNGTWTGDTQLFNYINSFTDIDLVTPGNQPLDPGLSSYNNASIIEFDFLPFTDNMSFNFLFASEEYGTFQCDFSDAFAFFLTNTVTNTTTNLALVPGTTPPLPIAVTTIRNQLFNGGCVSENQSYFGSYNGGANAATSATNFEGQTVKMTAASTVVANNLYHIKLVIADRNDNSYDSAVFIEGGSFNVGVADLTYPIGLGGAYTQDMLVSNGNAICPGESRVISTGLSAATFDFVWTRNGVNLNIDAPSITVTQPGTYCVNASISGGGACSQTDCIIVEYFTGFPINHTPGDMNVCNANVNLLTQNTAILAGLDPTTHDVEYYYSLADAQNSNNPIPGSFVATLGSTPIVAKVINIFAACPEYATFNVIFGVCTIPTTQPSDLVVCDDVSNNGTEIFNLNPQTAVVLGALSPADYTVTYHLSQLAADAGTGAISPANAYANISNPQTIYIRIVQNSDTTIFNTTRNFQLRVLPQPVVTSFTGTTTICKGSSTNLTFAGTPNATITYSNGTTNQTVLLDASGNATVSVSPTLNTTYTLVDIATNGTPNCTNSAAGSVVITVNNLPLVSNTLLNIQACVNDTWSQVFWGTPNATITITDGTNTYYVVLDAAGTQTWTLPLSNTTIFTLTNIASATTPVCNQVLSLSYTVTVVPLATASATGNTTCINTTGQLTFTGSPYATVSFTDGVTTYSQLLDATGNGVWTSPILTTSTTYTLTNVMSGPLNPICDNTLTSTATINVNLQPTAGTDGATTICETSVVSINLFSLITGEQLGGTWTRTGGAGGIFNAAAGTFVPAVGATTSTFTYTLTGTAPCIDDSSVATVNINAQPNAGTDATTTVCESSVAVIDLFGLITGEQSGGTWTRTGGTGGAFNAAAGTFTPAAGATNSTFMYTLLGTLPCVNDSSVATVNFSAQPNAGTDGGIAICDNSSTIINLYSLITGEQAGGVWTRTTGTGGTFNAAAGTFTPSVGATTSAFVYLLSATAPCTSDSSVATIKVNPIPTGIAISGTTTTCAGIPVNLTVTGTPGSVITWTGTPGSFTIGASGSNVISVSPIANTTYTLTSASLNGCTIPVIGQSATVSVSATPQFITQIPDITICNGGTLNIASQLTSTVPGAIFIWSATTSNVNTGAVSGDQTNIDQLVTLINSLQNGTINIEVKPQIGSCSGASQQILVTVKSIPVITSTVSNKTVICNNEFVTIASNTNPAATIYNWQVNTATGVQIVGGATSGTSTTGIINLQLALTNPLVAGTISFDFTPVNGICTGATVANAVTISVNPIPGTPIGLPVNKICSGETTVLTISSFPVITGTTLVWTVIDSQNVTGFANGTGTAPFTITDVLINTSNVQGFVKYSVTSKLGNCEGGTTEYIVLVNPLPKPNLLDGHICVNQTTGITYQGYVLDAQLSNPNFTYDWYILNTTTNVYDALPSSNSSTYEAMSPGTYQVVVTNTVTGCKQTDQAIVTTVYPATAFTTVVTDAFTNEATITVTVNPMGTGNLIYALDGGAWQSSNVFTGVDAGEHEISVEDVEGCTNLTQTIIVIDYPKYFTPNGDGIHDTWKIIGLEAKHNAKIYIFDRYGKLIKQIDPLGSGWDGKYNGQDIPSTDYWFNIDYTENNQEKQFKAHFSLKR